MPLTATFKLFPLVKVAFYCDCGPHNQKVYERNTVMSAATKWIIFFNVSKSRQIRIWQAVSNNISFTFCNEVLFCIAQFSQQWSFNEHQLVYTILSLTFGVWIFNFLLGWLFKKKIKNTHTLFLNVFRPDQLWSKVCSKQ